jgi:ATP-binding cassette subfamily B protein
MSAYNEEEYNKPLSLKIWAKMLPFLKPYRKEMLFIVALMTVSALIDVLFPIMQGYAVNNFIMAGTTENLGWFAAAYLTFVLIQTAIVILFARLAMSVEMNVGKDMRRDTFVHLQTLSFTYYNTTPVGYLMARTTSDTGRIAGMIAWGLVDTLWALCYVIGAFISMFMLNARLALIVVLVVPFIVALTIFFQNKILHLNRKIRRINSRITGAFNEGIVGAKTSKTIVIEEQNEKEFSKITGEMAQKSIKAARLNAIYIPLIMLFSSMATALVLARGGLLVMNEVLLFGTFSAFISYAVGIFEPIQQLARTFSEIISAQANIERVSELLEHKPDITDTPEVIEKYGDAFEPKKENWEPIRGDIEFRDVSFKYPDGGEYVLEHFNLKIPAGQNVAIVGETGAGKSTLVNLACRFFEPTEGQILIDGVDYRERSQLWLHSNIGYVLQSPHLFSGSVRENIRYGKLDATDEDIERVAKRVSADVVVSKLERGYDSDVGEGGDKLSTGEKQLISFARAVLADPRIFVLDEATSSIDTQTEQLIQNAISTLLENRTSFLIAHRLSTIRHADLILVVKAGKIIEQGTHEELIAKKGYYFSLYNKQFEEEAAMRLLNSQTAE